MLKRVPTSLRQQINRIQTQYPSHIILTQVGMFYEIIGDYIEEICSILNLRIGSRKVLSEDPRMAGFPVYELNKYANCLLKHGKSVCIVDQMEQHPTSDVTPRKVVRILTPGTLLDDGEFTSIDNNFLLSVYRKSKTSKTLGLSWIDISTGEFLMTDSSLSDFPNFISRIQPKEIIVSESLNCWSDSLNRLLKPTEIENIVLTVKSDNFFISSTAEAHLASVVIANEPQKQILKTTPSMVLKNIPEPQLKSAIGLVAYIQENFPTICPPIRTPLNVNSETMQIDFNTIQALEIIQTQKNRQREGSLISVMATTRTPGGKRLLASRIKAPSTSLKEIESRLDLVQLFHDDLYLSRVVSDELSNIKDIEKALQRLHVSHSVSDLFVVLDGLRVVEKLKLLLKGRKIIMKQLVKGLGKLKSAWEKYDGLLNINNLENGKITGTDVLMDGYCDKIDDLRIYLAKLKSEEEEKIDVMDALFGNSS
jgi:DNA mismatch repair protein MutS